MKTKGVRQLQVGTDLVVRAEFSKLVEQQIDENLSLLAALLESCSLRWQPKGCCVIAVAVQNCLCRLLLLWSHFCVASADWTSSCAGEWHLLACPGDAHQPAVLRGHCVVCSRLSSGVPHWTPVFDSVQRSASQLASLLAAPLDAETQKIGVRTLICKSWCGSAGCVVVSRKPQTVTERRPGEWTASPSRFGWLCLDDSPCRVRLPLYHPTCQVSKPKSAAVVVD